MDKHEEKAKKVYIPVSTVNTTACVTIQTAHHMYSIPLHFQATHRMSMHIQNL